jgi:hypothetical protein
MITREQYRAARRERDEARAELMGVKRALGNTRADLDVAESRKSDVIQGLLRDRDALRAALEKADNRLSQYTLGCPCPGVSCVEHCRECDTTYALVNEIRAALAAVQAKEKT